MIEDLGLRDYREVWAAMGAFTEARTPETPDAIWLVEHPPVFTLGMNGDPRHILDPGGIPVIRTDRGGQVTYHGPGQAVVYPLLDLRRLGMGVKALVTSLEQAVIAFLDTLGIPGETLPRAPGVYVEGEKIASVGLRVKRGCCYHGLSLNADMDLAPFARIHPCGYPGLGVTSLGKLGVSMAAREAGWAIARILKEKL